MAEIVGAVASASQLASTCFSLVDLLKRIKGASMTLQKYQEHLQDLRTLSESISKNPLLQTSEVELHTQSLLLLIDSSELDSILRKNRLGRAWYLVQRDQYLHETFTALERKKTSLTLAIEHIQAQTLHQIHLDVGAMAFDQKKKKKAPATEAGASSSGTSEEMKRTLYADEIIERGSESYEAAQQLRRTQQVEYMHEPRFPDAEVAVGTFNNCTTTGGAAQRNGVAVIGPAEYVSQVKRPRFYGEYHNCNKTGPGSFVNGLDIVPIDGPYTGAFPGMNGNWVNCHHADKDRKAEETRDETGGTFFGGRILHVKSKQDQTEDKS